MSHTCSNETNRSAARPRFRFNPFEIAVVGPAGPMRTGLVDALLDAGIHARDDGPALKLGRVLLDGPPDGPPAIAMVSAVDRDGLRTVRYPVEVDACLPASPLLECDAVLIETDKATDCGAVCLVDETTAAVPENAIAAVGRGLFRPGLPRDLPYFSLDESRGLATFLGAHLAGRATQAPLYGLVLAGGASSRMRRDKAALAYHGKPQTEVALDLLSRFCAQTFVSIRADQAEAEGRRGLPQLHDAFLGLGPMGGILSAQRAHPHAAWLALACDLPFVDAGLLEDLVSRRAPFTNATAYQSAHDGMPEPLCTIYEPKSVLRLLAFLGRGYQCPRKVLINSRTALLNLPRASALDNVNRPEEYEQTIAALEKGTNGKRG